MDTKKLKELMRADARERKGISHNPNPEPGIWTTREGDEIPICDMKDSHILNAIRLLEEAGERGPEDFGPQPRGEMAAEAWIDAISDYYAGEGEIRRGLDALTGEAVGRGLDITSIPERTKPKSPPRSNGFYAYDPFGNDHYYDPPEDLIKSRGVDLDQLHEWGYEEPF